jgi:hypothetical protein
MTITYAVQRRRRVRGFQLYEMLAKAEKNCHVGYIIECMAFTQGRITLTQQVVHRGRQKMTRSLKPDAASLEGPTQRVEGTAGQRSCTSVLAHDVVRSCGFDGLSTG